MLEYLEYTEVGGTDSRHDIEVYALSTCGFCKRAIAFLRDNGLAYRYVYVDDLPFETKTRVREALVERFNRSISYPFAIVDNTKYLVGFIEVSWRTMLLEKGTEQ